MPLFIQLFSVVKFLRYMLCILSSQPNPSIFGSTQKILQHINVLIPCVINMIKAICLEIYIMLMFSSKFGLEIYSGLGLNLLLYIGFQYGLIKMQILSKLIMWTLKKKERKSFQMLLHASRFDLLLHLT